MIIFLISLYALTLWYYFMKNKKINKHIDDKIMVLEKRKEKIESTINDKKGDKIIIACMEIENYDSHIKLLKSFKNYFK